MTNGNVIVCKAVAPRSSPNMYLASTAFSILESGVTQTKRMAPAWESLHPNLT